MLITTQELADLQGVEYLTATGLIRYLKEKGLIVEVEKRKPKGKGKPTNVYEIPEVITLDFTSAAGRANC